MTATHRVGSSGTGVFKLAMVPGLGFGASIYAVHGTPGPLPGRSAAGPSRHASSPMC